MKDLFFKKAIRIFELLKHYLGTAFFSSGVLVWSGKERGDKRTLLCSFWVSDFYTITLNLTFLLILDTNKIYKMLKQISLDQFPVT